MKRLDVANASAGVAVALIILATLLRIAPHPANFAPVMAVALFGGAVLPRRLAVITPLLAMIISDVVIGMYDWRIMLTVWACYGIVALASSYWLRSGNVARGAALTLAASTSFFAVTNFAVWAASGMYTHTWQGLSDCYYMALPFFRNTMLSDMLYTILLFAAWRLALLAATRMLVRFGSMVHRV